MTRLRDLGEIASEHNILIFETIAAAWRREFTADADGQVMLLTSSRWQIPRSLRDVSEWLRKSGAPESLSARWDALADALEGDPRPDMPDDQEIVERWAYGRIVDHVALSLRPGWTIDDLIRRKAEIDRPFFRPPIPPSLLDDYERISKEFGRTRRRVAERALRHYLRPDQEGGQILAAIKSGAHETGEIARIIRRWDDENS